MKLFISLYTITKVNIPRKHTTYVHNYYSKYLWEAYYVHMYVIIIYGCFFLPQEGVVMPRAY